MSKQKSCSNFRGPIVSLQSRAEKSGITLTPSLKAAVYDGNAWAIMVGAGESYLSAYAVFLQAAPLQLGILASLPPFIGAIGQIFGLWTLQFLTSRRKLIVRACVVNALIWIPIGCISFLFDPGPGTVWYLLFFLVVYFGSGGLGGPAWNSLIGDLVPEEVRGTYFGLRNRYVGLYTFLAMVAAGQVLQLSTMWGSTGAGYLILFIAAAASRFVSRYWLAQYEDVPAKTSSHHYFSFWQFIARSPRSNFARFVFYISIINGAVAFSGPFFTLHMLRDLKFSYFQFTTAAAASVVVQFLTMQYWGRLMDVFGSKKILNILGFAVALAPVLWLFNSSFGYVLCVQFFNGSVWAGFNLAAATFLFDAVTPAKRARCTAYQSIVNGVCVLIGAVSGGLLAQFLPSSVSILGMSWTPVYPLFFLFLISGLLRLTASLIFLPRFREVSEVQPIKHRDLLFRITGLRPISGVTFSLITGMTRKKKVGS